jgi:hypothetical protein
LKTEYGGWRGIRTPELVREQIYSLPPLTAWLSTLRGIFFRRKWSQHSDLNRGPAAYKADALPLSYAGVFLKAVAFCRKNTCFVKATFFLKSLRRERILKEDKNGKLFIFEFIFSPRRILCKFFASP